MPPQKRPIKDAQREEHEWAMDDLQDAVDATAGEGDQEGQRENLRRARDRESAAHDARFGRRRNGDGNGRN